MHEIHAQCWVDGDGLKHLLSRPSTLLLMVTNALLTTLRTPTISFALATTITVFDLTPYFQTVRALISRFEQLHLLLRKVRLVHAFPTPRLMLAILTWHSWQFAQRTYAKLVAWMRGTFTSRAVHLNGVTTRIVICLHHTALHTCVNVRVIE